MINKIENQMKVIRNVGEIYEVTVKNIKTGEIEYQNKGFGGLFCTVEKILSTSKGEVKGNHQTVGWGHPMIIFYSLQRLQEFVKKNSSDFIDAIMKNKGGL